MAKSLKNQSRGISQRKRKGIKKLSEKEEEILESLARIYEKDPHHAIKRLDLASILLCSPALINKLLNSLDERKLISREKYGGIKLTDKGLEDSNALIRRHRVSEKLFSYLLGLNDADAHDFACKIEHILEDKITDKIEEILRNIGSCPYCGQPILSELKKDETTNIFPLNSFVAGKMVKIVQISTEDQEFLRRLSQIGLAIGAIIGIIEKSELDNTLIIAVDNRIVPMGPEIARKILAISLKTNGE